MSKTGLPLFELTLCVVLLAVGWAAFRVYQLAGQMEFGAATEGVAARAPVEPPGANPMLPAERGAAPDLARTGLHLQGVFYALAGTVAGLCLLLFAAVYRRLVVTPLERKLFESQTLLEQQDKLAHFGQLLGGLAHEIGNPLTAINARLYTLQKALAEGSPQHQDAVVIRNEISRLDQTVKDYLRLVRPANPRFTSLTAEPVLREVRDLLALELETRSIALQLDLTVARPFRADPQQLKQVLINLVQNAADASGAGGAITLRAREARTRLRETAAEVVILEVADTGAGIPPEVQDKIFEPFFSTKETGTGLGLPIAARIIDRHLGCLEFETKLGQGTTFRVVLPASTPG